VTGHMRAAIYIRISKRC